MFAGTPHWRSTLSQMVAHVDARLEPPPLELSLRATRIERTEERGRDTEETKRWQGASTFVAVACVRGYFFLVALAIFVATDR